MVKCRAGGGLKRARKLGHALHIITGHLNDPHSTISINNAEHIVHKTGTHWDEGHIGKSTPVLHHQLHDVQALKTTTPTVRLESQSAVLSASMSVRSNVQQSMVSISGREENCSAGGGG